MGKVKWHLNIYGEGITQSVKSVNDNIWHHLIGTYDGSILKLYIDGLLDSTDDSPGSCSNPNINFQIGRWVGGSSQYFNGLIDEVRIYNRVLSAEEIRFHYNLLKPLFQ